MRNSVKKIIMLMLVSVILVMNSTVPVKALTLTGDERAEAYGQTAVTAYVEMPEESEDNGYIKTGDENPTGTYVALLLMSMVVIVANGIRVYKQDE